MNAPPTWADFEMAVRQWERRQYDGIGFVLAASDQYVGADFDDSRDPATGEVNPSVALQLTRLNTYTEVSPSGTGVKCLMRGRLAGSGVRRDGIELYASGRFFTITGHVLPGYNTVVDAADALNDLYQEITSRGSRAMATEAILGANEPTCPLCVTDETILAKAKAARNGEKFTRLWRGDMSDHQADYSAADLALCRILAFWCGPRPDRIDGLFRQSRLYRPKWDEPHFANGETYGAATVAVAIKYQTHHYTWTAAERMGIG